MLFDQPGYCAVFSLESLCNDEDISGDTSAHRYEEKLRPLLLPDTVEPGDLDD